MNRRKNKIWACLLSVVMIVSLLPAATFALDGDGTSDSPYLVGTEAELREAIASDNAYIQLTADIELQNHLEISKSVTIIGTNGTENRQINNKIVYVSGDGITVNFTNVDFSRTSGNCLLVVGRNMAQTAASSPTVVLEGCNISSTSSNTNGTVNFTGGSLTMTGSSVSGAPYGIILNGLLNNSPIAGDVSRTLVLTDTDVTSSAANGGKAIITNVGTKSGDTISVTGGTLSGWNAFTFMGSGVRTTLTDVTIECENPYSSGQNNYGAIVFGASSDNDLIYGNSVTVNGGSVTCAGNGTSSSNEYVASFYNTDNTLSFSGTEISASGNTSEAFFIYSFVTSSSSPYAAYRPGDAEPVTLDGVSFNGFMIEAAGEKFINIYSSLAEAVSAAEAGNTVVLGQDTAENVTVDKDIVIDFNGKTADGVVPADGSVLVYDKDEQTVSQVEPENLSEAVSIDEFGFKADASDASAAINEALGNGTVSDCDDNTAYIVLSNRVKGDLTVRVTKGDQAVYTETLTDAASAKTVYFTFEPDGGSAAQLPIAAGEYKVELMAGDVVVASATLKIYEVRFDADGNVTSGGFFMLDDVASASTPADPSKEGYVFKGWGEAVTDDTACTVTYTAQWEEEPTDPDPEEPTDPDPEDPTDPDPEDPTDPDPEDPTDPDPEDPTDPDPEDPTDPDPEDPTDPDPEDPSDTDDDTDSPGTADSAELWIWASLTLVCAGAVITLTVRRRKQTV